MGFKINYRSDRPITAAEAEVIQQAADAGCLGRTWLHCEPVHFYPLEADGFLIGGSKPNFQPDLDDAASAALEALPDGTSRDMLDVLCQISRDHEINWLLSHDHDPNIGSIRKGVCDPSVINEIEAFADLGDILGGLEWDEES